MWDHSEQECIPVGCVPSAAVAVLVGGVLGGPAQSEGCLLGRGICLGGCTPPMDRMTNACENILFPPLLLPDGNEAKSFKSTHARIEFPATFALRVKWSYSVKVKDTRSGYSSGY